MTGWKLRWYVRIQRILARLGVKLPGKIMYIGGSDTLPPPLSKMEEAELIARLDGGRRRSNPSSLSGTCGWWCTLPAGLKTPAWALRT